MKKVMLAMSMMMSLAHSAVASAQIEDKVVCEATWRYFKMLWMRDHEAAAS